MKFQRFRFKLTALILAMLIILAGVRGFLTAPMPEELPSLRSAILRLTGQEDPTVESPGSNFLPPFTPAPSGNPDSFSGLLSDYFSPAVPESGDSLPSESPSSTSLFHFPSASAVPEDGGESSGYDTTGLGSAPAPVNP